MTHETRFADPRRKHLTLRPCVDVTPSLLPPEAMVALFKVLNTIDYPPRYNITPTQPIVAVAERLGQAHRRSCSAGGLYRAG